MKEVEVLSGISKKEFDIKIAEFTKKFAPIC